MAGNITPGLVELVRRSHEREGNRIDNRRDLTSLTTEDVWESFHYPIFLGDMTKSSQAVYAKDVLAEVLALDAALAAMEDENWSAQVRHLLDEARAASRGTAGEGLKLAALKHVERQLEGQRLLRTITTASTFAVNASVESIVATRGDFNGEFEFADGTVREGTIFGVAHIKFVIWMHGLGLGTTLTPPTGSIAAALHSIGIPGYGRQEPTSADDFIEELGSGPSMKFGKMCTDVRGLTDRLRPQVAPALVPKETQFALWLLGTTRGLVATDAKAKRAVTPESLVAYMDEMGLTIDDYDAQLADVDEVGDLTSSVRHFLTA